MEANDTLKATSHLTISMRGQHEMGKIQRNNYHHWCCGPSLGKCHFLPGGGAPENWGDQVLCLRSKGGSKDFFKLKRGDHLYFFKEIKYFVKHSWNSC